MNKRAKNRLMLMATLIMLALTAALITRNEGYVFQNEGRLTVRPDPDDNHAVIFEWRSEVAVPMARRFEEAFDEWGDKTDRIVIDLHSPGGAIREGEAVIGVIEQMKETHVVDTRVGPRRSCYSMCVPIFLQGDVREAYQSSRFMFHRPTAYDFVTGKKISEPEFEKEMAARRFINRYFVNVGVDSHWLDVLQANWHDRDIWKTGRELVDEKSGIVTELE